MVCQSYGKAEPCLTSGGGAVTRQPLVSRKASAQGLVKYINAVKTVATLTQGKAEPCLTSGGGAVTRQPLVSRKASARLLRGRTESWQRITNQRTKTQGQRPKQALLRRTSFSFPTASVACI